MNQYASTFQLINDARKNGITFDTETLGFYSGQDMFSASYAKWGDKTPTTHFFDVKKSLPNASQFGLSAYDKMKDKFPTSSRKAFAQNLIKTLKDRPFLIGHNLTYDLGWVYETLNTTETAKELHELQRMISGTSDPELGKLIKRKRAGETLSAEEMKTYKSAKYNRRTISSGGGRFGKSLKNAVDKKYGFVQAYQSFLDTTSKVRSEKRVAVVDTNQMSKLFAGLASDLDLLTNRKAIGSKLELLTEALGVSSKEAHTDMDVLFNQKLMDAFAKGDLDKMVQHAEKQRNNVENAGRFTIGSLSDEGQQIIKMFKVVNGETDQKLFGALGQKPYESLADFNFYQSVGRANIEWNETEKAAIKVKRGRTPSYENDLGKLMDFFSEKYNKSLDEVSNAWSYYRGQFVDNKGNFDKVNAEKIMMKENDDMLTALKVGIQGYINPRQQKHAFSTDLLPSGSFKEAFTSPTAKRLALWGAAAVGAATVISSLSGGYKAPAPARISSNDDDYNTIEGLHPGGGVNKFMIQSMTDFGSGYQGPNPQLNPEYNRAEDVYKYEWMRASKIGLSESEMYKYMTEESPEASEFVAASANAGTALHEYLAAEGYRQGTAIDTEQLILDHSHKISGHIDIVDANLGVGDEKTVSAGIFDAIRRDGKPKDMHRAQVMYYLGQTGQSSGFIRYTDRDNINRQKVFNIKFDPYEYSRLISKVERVRSRVVADIESGRLDRSDLPMAAGPDTLLEADAQRIAPEIQIAEIEDRRKVFQEEMQYLRSVKRGMPNYGKGRARINKRNREDQSTQGIGLALYNHRNKHHIM